MTLANRTLTSPAQREMVIAEIQRLLEEEILVKGAGIFLSRHEVLGVVAEEYDELLKAVRKKSIEEVRAELMDVVIAAAFGIVSIDTREMDW